MKRHYQVLNRIWPAVLLLASGCAQRDPSQITATLVIRPGDQQFTVPEAPPQAPTEAPAPATTATAAAQTPAAQPAAVADATPAAEPAPATPATPAAQPAPSAAPAAAATAESTGTEFAAFKGRISVAGAAPVLPPLKAAGDPTVQDKVCVANAIPDESVVVGSDGGLANVFIFAKKMPAGVMPPPPPTEPAVIDQIGCRFVPQAMVLRVGQPLVLKNSDPVSHNVRTASLSMPLNQIIAPNNTTGITVSYARPERMPVQTKCDIHAWMLAWHFPIDHPYAAVSGPDGRFEVPNLPPGDWEFVIWHGRTGYIERSYKLKAAAGQAVTHDFSVPAAKLSQ